MVHMSTSSGLIKWEQQNQTYLIPSCLLITKSFYKGLESSGWQFQSNLIDMRIFMRLCYACMYMASCVTTSAHGPFKDFNIDDKLNYSTPTLALWNLNVPLSFCLVRSWNHHFSILFNYVKAGWTSNIWCMLDVADDFGYVCLDKGKES